MQLVLYELFRVRRFKMKLVVGLGNPGKDYEWTRHNAGFMVIDEIAKALNCDIDSKKFKALIGSTKYKGETILLMKPQTFMNLSGEALGEAMRFYKLEAKDIIVIYDDLDLPVGKIRLRPKGSAGGHNGVKSIIQHIHTQEFNRIRVGIDKDARIPVVNWVLSKFRKEEKDALMEAVSNACKATLYALDHSFTDTMSAFNKK